MSRKILTTLNINELLIPGDNLLHAFLGIYNIPGNGNFILPNPNPPQLTTLCKFKIKANGSIRLKTFYRTDSDIGRDKSRGIRQIVYINDMETCVTDIANNYGICIDTDIQIKENDVVEIKYIMLERYNGHRVGSYAAVCCGNNINSIVTNI